MMKLGSATLGRVSSERRSSSPAAKLLRVEPSFKWERAGANPPLAANARDEPRRARTEPVRVHRRFRSTASNMDRVQGVPVHTSPTPKGKPPDAVGHLLTASSRSGLRGQPEARYF